MDISNEEITQMIAAIKAIQDPKTDWYLVDSRYFLFMRIWPDISALMIMEDPTLVKEGTKICDLLRKVWFKAIDKFNAEKARSTLCNTTLTHEELFRFIADVAEIKDPVFQQQSLSLHNDTGSKIFAALDSAVVNYCCPNEGESLSTDLELFQKLKKSSVDITEKTLNTTWSLYRRLPAGLRKHYTEQATHLSRCIGYCCFCLSKKAETVEIDSIEKPSCHISIINTICDTAQRTIRTRQHARDPLGSGL